MDENIRFILLPQQNRRLPPHKSLQKTYGIKGAGILSLPISWTPPFFLISALLYERYRDIADATPSLVLNNILANDEPYVLESALKQIASLDNDFVIVRSSTSDEDIEYRGHYKSLTCNAVPEQLSLAISKVFAYCPLEVGTTMGLVVQRYVRTCRASGHLSNERRISKRNSSWICEFDTVSGVGAPRIEPLSSHRVRPADVDGPLMSSSWEDLIERLRQLGAWGQAQKLHLHFEWIWDGSHLWVVQADECTYTRSRPSFASTHKIIKAPRERLLSVVLPEQNVAKGIWSKLDCVKAFRECGLPTTKLWVLNDKSILVELNAGKCPRRLRRDLQALLGAPIVIRTDFALQNDLAGLLLPRTDTVSSLEAAEDFLVGVSKQMDKALVAEGKLCFIIHRFIPSRSSAFGFADPQRGRVRIDGIWGLPDGLAFYAHDSFDIPNDGIGRIYPHARYKGEYLDLDREGRWVRKLLGAPYDWKPSLTNEELRMIGRGTFAVAQAVGAPVQVMWFVGIPQGFGHPRCLPWYYTTQEVPRKLVSHKKSVVQKEPIIRRREDLDVLRCELEEPTSIKKIRLRPIPELLRSKDFIEDVAALARKLSVAVVMEGSVLSHAYYLLRNSGVNVICADLFAPQFEPKPFQKLVRDLIPLKIRSHGEKAKIVRVTGDELASILKAKAVEEALELFWSETSDQDKEEMVDLLEVINCLSHHKGVRKGDLDILAENKRAKRGGFAQGFVLEETEEIPLLILAPESPNLFADLKSTEPDSLDLEPRQGDKAEIGTAPRLEGPKLIIPLVPPHPEHRHISHSFILRWAGVSLNIRFREKDLVVEVSPHREKQMRLFDS